MSYGTRQMARLGSYIFSIGKKPENIYGFCCRATKREATLDF